MKAAMMLVGVSAIAAPGATWCHWRKVIKPGVALASGQCLEGLS